MINEPREKFVLFGLRAPQQHLIAFLEIAFISILSRRLARLASQQISD